MIPTSENDHVIKFDGAIQHPVHCRIHECHVLADRRHVKRLVAALTRVVTEQEHLPRVASAWHQFVFDQDTFVEFANLVEQELIPIQIIQEKT